MMRHPLWHHKVNSFGNIQSKIKATMPDLGPDNNIFTGFLDDLNGVKTDANETEIFKKERKKRRNSRDYNQCDAIPKRRDP